MRGMSGRTSAAALERRHALAGQAQGSEMRRLLRPGARAPAEPRRESEPPADGRGPSPHAPRPPPALPEPDRHGAQRPAPATLTGIE